MLTRTTCCFNTHINSGMITTAKQMNRTSIRLPILGGWEVGSWEVHKSIVSAMF